ncbi:MAG TPA: sugar phosphate isomerase/epimerase family protein [Pyrinomonadaceae bacterium]|nr:sugar phosphate isomerase/epimerase family protein [Pyrinomonadaceae bacterium]
MKLAFSTLGCPDWNLHTMIGAARKCGYAGIELRALAGSLDLLSRTEFSARQLPSTRAYLKDEGIDICCVDTSCTFHSPDAGERADQVRIALAYAELAAKLGAPLIRVFPDKIQPGAQREKTRDWIAECLRIVAQRMPDDVDVALETHGDFARAEATAEIAALANHPKVKLIWDVANSVAAGDTIEQAGRVVKPYLAHIHLRDAKPVAGSEHWLPVLAGHGLVSFAEILAAIRELNYDGYISFEWEKYWRPEIEEPEVALPDFVNAIRNLLWDQSDTTKRSGVGK